MIIVGSAISFSLKSLSRLVELCNELFIMFCCYYSYAKHDRVQNSQKYSWYPRDDLGVSIPRFDCGRESPTPFLGRWNVANCKEMPSELNRRYVKKQPNSFPCRRWDDQSGRAEASDVNEGNKSVRESAVSYFSLAHAFACVGERLKTRFSSLS